MHPSRMALVFTFALTALTSLSATQTPRSPALIEPLPPVRPLAELIARAPGRAAERLLAAGDWTGGSQAALDLLLGDASEPSSQPSADALVLLALAKAGLGDEEGALCRWHAAQLLDPELLAADLTAYGAAGRLLEDQPLENLEKREQGPPRRVGSNVLKPELLTQRAPEYTILARKSRVAGTVVLEAVIGTDGVVSQARVLKGLPFGLSAASIDAICDWRFKPATLNDEPVDVYYILTVNFQVQEDPPAGSAPAPPTP